MALPLNVYKRLVGIVSTTPETIYTTPIGYTGVVLLAQVANLSPNTEQVLFSLVDPNLNIYEILPNSPVSSEDSIKLFTGKLFASSGDTLQLSGTNGTDMKYAFSILETLN